MKCTFCAYETDKKANLTRHIRLVHTDTAPAFSCSICDRKFKYEHNLRRHMVMKKCTTSTQQNINMAQQNINMAQQNINIDQQNINIDQQNINIDQQNINIANMCDRCNKTLASKQSLQRHIAVCDGTLNAKMCPNCHKTFAFTQSKHHHLKTCQSTQLVAINQTPTALSNCPITNNIDTQNNIQNSVVNNTHNTTQNNTHNDNSKNIQNITIVAFNPEDITSIVPLLTDHIDIKAMKRAIKTQDKPDVLLKYTKELMKKPENRCIKKTNMRSSHSSVHVGNNNWELKPDALIYPKFVSDIASMSQELLEKCKHHPSIPDHIIQGLIAFNEYMADNGYCNDEQQVQERIKHNYRRVVAGAKSIVYEQTVADQK